MIVWGRCRLLEEPFLSRPVEVPDCMRKDLDVLYNPNYLPVPLEIGVFNYFFQIRHFCRSVNDYCRGKTHNALWP